MINNSRTEIINANSPNINIIETKTNGPMKIQDNNNNSNRNDPNKRQSLPP